MLRTNFRKSLHVNDVNVDIVEQVRRRLMVGVVLLQRMTIEFSELALTLHVCQG
jgi:hypothetical protein